MLDELAREAAAEGRIKEAAMYVLKRPRSIVINNYKRTTTTQLMGPSSSTSALFIFALIISSTLESGF
eukprot:g83385.t1